MDYLYAKIVDSAGTSIYADNSTGSPCDWGNSDGNNDVKVGATLVISTGTFTPNKPNDDHVVVTAAFIDGTQQVILDTYV